MQRFTINGINSIPAGYKEIQNFNGGDDDYLCLDHILKEFIKCENGSFFNNESLEPYQHDKEITLTILRDSKWMF